jgi:hypothetical protein
LRGLSFGIAPSHVKGKSRPGITPSGFSSNCQSPGSVAGMTTSIRRKGFSRQQGYSFPLRSRSSAGRVVERSSADAFVCGFKRSPDRSDASIVGAASKRHRTVRYQRQVATRDR